MNSIELPKSSLVAPACSALAMGLVLLTFPALSRAQQATTPQWTKGVSAPTASPASTPTPGKTTPTSTAAPQPHHAKHAVKKTEAEAPAAPPKPVVPPTPAEMPAQPAVVHFVNGTLSVRASNSSLEQILREVGSQTGVQIQGVPGDERVFGVFGPGRADHVLAQLLDGSDSNYLMLGHTASNAPKVLVITPRTSLAPGAQTAQAAQPAAGDDDEDDDAPPPERPAPMHPLIPNGAGATTGARTPQQILEEMQQRRQQEQQEQQNNPQ